MSMISPKEWSEARLTVVRLGLQFTHKNWGFLVEQVYLGDNYFRSQKWSTGGTPEEMMGHLAGVLAGVPPYITEGQLHQILSSDVAGPALVWGTGCFVYPRPDYNFGELWLDQGVKIVHAPKRPITDAPDAFMRAVLTEFGWPEWAAERVYPVETTPSPFSDEMELPWLTT